MFHQVKAWEDTIVSRLTVTMAGTGPEYEYPTTGKDETIPVVSNEDPVSEGGQGTEPVVGEDYDVMDDKAIAGICDFVSPCYSCTFASLGSPYFYVHTAMFLAPKHANTFQRFPNLVYTESVTTFW